MSIVIPTRTCRECGWTTTELHYMVRSGLALPAEYVCASRATCERRQRANRT